MVEIAPLLRLRIYRPPSAEKWISYHKRCVISHHITLGRHSRLFMSRNLSFWRDLASEMSPTLVREAHFFWWYFWVKMSPILKGDNKSTDFRSWILFFRFQSRVREFFSIKLFTLFFPKFFSNVYKFDIFGNISLCPIRLYELFL